MIAKIKKILPIIKAGRIFINSDYLRQVGWWNSYNSQKPLDKDDNPVPWVTYSFIDFIASRLNKELTLFEFGSGNSTLYYALRVKHVTALEHDEGWFNQLRKDVPVNVSLLFEKLEYNGKYCRSALNRGIKYEIIIVDGRDRVNCILHSLEALNENGVVVLDDSERDDYVNAIDFLVSNGFRRLDFWGIAPGLTYKKCTTVFYKANNCLNI